MGPSVLSSHYASEVSALQVSLHFICTYYRRQAKLREGNVFTPVCHSVHRGGGVSVPACTTDHMNSGGLCPGRVSVQRRSLTWVGESLPRGVFVQGWRSLLGRPPGQRHPPYGNERTVCILLECILVHFCWYSVSTFKIYEECYVLFSGAKVAQYSGINLHKQIVAEPAYGKILLSWIV